MKLKLFWFFLIAAVFLNLDVSAQPELDTTFSSDGKVAVQSFSISSADGLAIQPDNKVIMGGSCNHVSFGFIPICLVRLNENGSMDTTFGTVGAGYVLTNIPQSSSDRGSSEVALQPDGKIVVAGWDSFSIVVARYHSNGTLDTSFGTNGFMRNSIGGNVRPKGLAVQPDGKIVVVGYSSAGSSVAQFVARLLPNGALDSSFRQGGIVRLDITGYNTTGLSLGLQADGKIVTGGSMWTVAGTPVPSASFLLTRLNRDGSLDTTFDEDGYKAVAFGGISNGSVGFTGLAVQSDARIAAVSSTNILYRFNADGSPDNDFDSDGSREALPGTATPSDLTVSPSGKITVIGIPAYFGSNYSTLLYRVARFLPDGSPDTGLNAAGFLNIDVLNPGSDGALTVALDSFGRTVVAGRSGQGTVLSPWEFANMTVARLIAAPAPQNVEFSGRVLDLDGKPVPNASVTLSADAAGTTYAGRTNFFGYFRLPGVQTAQTYTLSARAKSLNFYDRRVLVDDTVTNFLVVGEPQP